MEISENDAFFRHERGLRATSAGDVVSRLFEGRRGLRRDIVMNRHAAETGLPLDYS